MTLQDKIEYWKNYAKNHPKKPIMMQDLIDAGFELELE